MGTFLATRKMHPELAARIEASVRGRRGGRGASRSRWVALARAVALLLLVIIVCSVISLRRRDRQQFHDARSALLETVRARADSLTETQKGAAARVEGLLVKSAGNYEGDFVAAELRAPGAMTACLAREAVYVRMPLSSASSATSVVAAASNSYKDALLLCLVSPPGSRTEEALLRKARASYSGATMAERTANFHRLGDAEQGLPVLLPTFSARIESAARIDDVATLGAEFKKAPIEDATRALKASLLVFALDEQGGGQGSAELDGERPHNVRVHLVDLSTNTTLVRLRRHVDPRGISPATRAMYASGIDSCSLALGILDDIGAAPSSTPSAKK